MEFSESLDRKFKKLGFDNFREFYHFANQIPDYPNKQNALSEVHILDDLYSDPEEIGFIFLVAKDQQLEDWYIHSISASIQMDTKRNAEGIIVINNTYLDDKGKLPCKDEIRKELLEKLSIEKAKELSFSIQRYASQVNGTKRRL